MSIGFMTGEVHGYIWGMSNRCKHVNAKKEKVGRYLGSGQSCTRYHVRTTKHPK